MNGIHDLGGMAGFGPIVREADEPVFHARWEARIFAIVNALAGLGLTNVDEFRHAIERMPPAEYLATPYYEHWLAAIETLLAEKGLTSSDMAEDAPARAANPTPPGRRASGGTSASGAPAKRPRARFSPGDRVVARNLNPPGHTRLPRYVRGHRGVIVRDLGVFGFPDTNAHGGPDRRQHCYNVAFTGRELWGAGGRERVHIDLWEDYLAPLDHARPKTGPAGAAPRVSRKRARSHER